MPNTINPITPDDVRSALAARGATLSCSVCHGEDFAIERAAVRDAGHQTLGHVTHEVAQAVCETCGHVEAFDAARLTQRVPETAPIAGGLRVAA